MAKIKPPKPEPVVDPADEALKASVREWVKAKMDATPKDRRASTMPGWLSILIGPLTFIIQAVIQELLKNKS